MPPIARECACGRWYRDWRRKTCRQCRLRPQLCPAADCGRPHRSEYRYCSSCRRARAHISKPRMDNLPRAIAAQERWNARQRRLEATADRDYDPYEGPRSAQAKARRLAFQREHGVRVCANSDCQRHHRDRSRALCRQCRLVDHASCADCSKPFRGEPSATVCNSCRNRSKRARRRVGAEGAGYYDATGALVDSVV